MPADAWVRARTERSSARSLCGAQDLECPLPLHRSLCVVDQQPRVAGGSVEVRPLFPRLSSMIGSSANLVPLVSLARYFGKKQGLGPLKAILQHGRALVYLRCLQTDASSGNTPDGPFRASTAISTASSHCTLTCWPESTRDSVARDSPGLEPVATLRGVRKPCDGTLPLSRSIVRSPRSQRGIACPPHRHP